MMKQKKRISLMVGVAVLILGLAGCAAPGPKFSGLQQVSAGKAELIVYRKSALFASATAMPLLIDGKQVGELYNASFLQQQLLPGEHTVKVIPGGMAQATETAITLSPGERTFLHYDFPTGPLANVFFIGATIEKRDDVTALEDLKELNSAKPSVSATR